MSKKIILILILICLSCSAFSDNHSGNKIQHSAKFYVVLDTSGSMLRYNTDIIHNILAIRHQTTQHSQFSSTALLQNINLYSFTDRSKSISIDSDTDIFSAVDTISVGGGKEDGLIALEKIMLDPLANNIHILLFTDEGRDIIKDVNLKQLITQAQQKHIIVHAILSTQHICKNKNVIGINNNLIAYTIDKLQIDCQGKINQHTKSKNDDYVKLALQSGGMVWSINTIYPPNYRFKENRLKKNQAKEYQYEKEITPKTSPAQASFIEFIANELKNSHPKSTQIDISIMGELTLNNIITINVNLAKNNSNNADSTLEWDINNDGIIDDYGPIINVELTKVGDEKITLWVMKEVNGKTVRLRQQVNLLVK